MKIIKKAFWFIWGLPQNLLGLAIYLILRRKAAHVSKYKDSRVLYTHWRHGAMSLGMYIFMFGEYYLNDERTKKHEYGHSIQSKILGPLYLLVIGLPSIIWAGLFDEWRRKHKKSYYWFYPEKWADKLGGVDR